MMSEHGKFSDPQYQERRRRAQRRRERQREADLSALMGQAWGRRIVHWMIFGDPSDEAPAEYMGRLMAETFEIGIKDGLSCAIRAAKSDGARAYAIELHNRIERAGPEAFALMIREQLDARIQDLALDIEPENQKDIEDD